MYTPKGAKPYLYYQELLTSAFGDIVFPNLHPFWTDEPSVHFCPTTGVKFVQNVLAESFLSASVPVVIHETWWPSGGGILDYTGTCDTASGFTPDAQKAFYQALKDTHQSSHPVFFFWGDLVDQSWKGSIANQEQSAWAKPGPYWGLFYSNYTAKPAVNLFASQTPEYECRPTPLPPGPPQPGPPGPSSPAAGSKTPAIIAISVIGGFVGLVGTFLGIRYLKYRRSGQRPDDNFIRMDEKA